LARNSEKTVDRRKYDPYILMRMRNIRKIKKEMKGRPVTYQRKLLLNLIKKAGGHISAKELYRLASRRNESISLATVYRTLRLFKELGLVEERRLGQVYCHYEMKDSVEHQHLVCRSCGKVIEFESPLFSQLAEELQRDHGFILKKIDVCMEGYCQECAKEVSDIKNLEIIGDSRWQDAEYRRSK
jgi:Fur family ferric uptake transcriptional regulator